MLTLSSLCRLPVLGPLSLLAWTGLTLGILPGSIFTACASGLAPCRMSITVLALLCLCRPVCNVRCGPCLGFPASSRYSRASDKRGLRFWVLPPPGVVLNSSRVSAPAVEATWGIPRAPDEFVKAAVESLGHLMSSSRPPSRQATPAVTSSLCPCPQESYPNQCQHTAG